MGKVLGRWVRRLESLEAVSAGLALTQDVRTLTPGETRALEPGQSGARRESKSKASGPKGGSSGPRSPATPQLQPLPMSTHPRPHLQPHIHTHIHFTHTHTHREGCEGPGPTPWTSGMSLEWYPVGGSMAVWLPRGWVLCIATDWPPRRHLSNRCTRPLVLTDLSH